MKDLRQMSLLLDFYGPLLTQRQQELMQAYFLEDLSLAEIADQDGVSRQAVHDLIKRAEALLLEYEEKLRCVREYEERQVKLTSLGEALARGDTVLALSLLAELKAE
ncbi:MAG: putative DNA-binding protein [Mycobacterium leprae]